MFIVGFLVLTVGGILMYDFSYATTVSNSFFEPLLRWGSIFMWVVAVFVLISGALNRGRR